jgi:hypothetical protein
MSAWLSLGPSNDSPEAVRIEIRAAEIAATLADSRVPHLSRCQEHGWEAHANNLAAAPILCEPPEHFHIGWRAREIVQHASMPGGR